MKKKLSFLLALLVMVVTGAWADTVVLGTPDASVTTLSDANGIVTVTDATGNTGVQLPPTWLRPRQRLDVCQPDTSAPEVGANGLKRPYRDVNRRQTYI